MHFQQHSQAIVFDFYEDSSKSKNFAQRGENSILPCQCLIAIFCGWMKACLNCLNICGLCIKCKCRDTESFSKYCTDLKEQCLCKYNFCWL